MNNLLLGYVVNLALGVVGVHLGKQSSKWQPAVSPPAYYITGFKVVKNWKSSFLTSKCSWPLVSLAANIRLGWKWLAPTNALPY